MSAAAKSLAAAAAALFICSDAGAALAETHTSPGRNVVVVPAGAPVRFASFGRYDVAKFNGGFKVKGAYRYGYLTNNPAADSTYGVLALFFTPDLPVAEQLPYWQGLAPPARLSFSNPRSFVRRVIPADDLTKLKKKKIFSISGRAEILVNNYHAEIECDSAHYTVRFVSLVRSQPTRLSQEFAREYRC